MRYLRIKLAYDGSDFVGWQVQPKQRTVQDAVQRAWRRVADHVDCWIAERANRQRRTRAGPGVQCGHAGGVHV